MKITFASYVGNQTGGIKSCFEACINAKDKNGNNLYCIEKLLLSYTNATKLNAEGLEKSIKEKYNISISLFNSNEAEEDFDNAIKSSEKIMFFVSGGQNFSVAQSVFNLYEDISYLVISERKNITVFDLENNYERHTIPFINLKTPEELISVHEGITIEKESFPSKLIEFLKYHNIKLPLGVIRDTTLENVKINGIHCDLVWNDGSDRLVFLSDLTRFDFGGEETVNNLKKDLLKIKEKIVSSSQSYDNKVLNQTLSSAINKAVDSRNEDDILNLQRTISEIIKHYNGKTDFVEEIKKVIDNCKKVARQNITRIASTKEGNGLYNLYDRRWYAICSNKAEVQHIKFESRRKISPLKQYGIFQRINGNICFGANSDKTKRNDVQKTTQHLKQSLLQIMRANGEDSFQDKTSINVNSDTLIVALGSDITATINASIAHKAHNHIKNVVIVATVNDSDIHDLAVNTRDYFEKIGLKTQILPTDISGSNLFKSLIKVDSATNIHVNITPGSKGQTASLSYWAVKNEAIIWSIFTKSSQLKCLKNDCLDSENFLVEACDIKEYLRILYPYANLFRDDTEDEKKFMSTLLKQMRACLNENKNWEQVWDEKKKFTAGGITLSYKRKKTNAFCSSNKNTNRGCFILKDTDNSVYTYEVDGGNWFESLTAQALREAGCHYVYARTRLPFEGDLQQYLENKHKDAFRIDMDAIASWHGVHVMVSCKAQDLENKKAIPLDCVAVEAQNVTASLNRFAIPIVCYLDKRGISQFVPENDQKKMAIPVIDWKDICQSEKLREILENARLNKSTNKFNSNSQTA